MPLPALGLAALPLLLAILAAVQGVSGRTAALAAIGLSALCLAGYVRLRRRALVEPTPYSWVLCGLAGTALLSLPVQDSGLIALTLAGPQLAIAWVWSRRVMPRPIHDRAWILVTILLIAVQALEM